MSKLSEKHCLKLVLNNYSYTFREDIPSTSEKFQDQKNSSSAVDRSVVQHPSNRDMFRKPPITVV